jgi:hypothetical protein
VALSTRLRETQSDVVGIGRSIIVCPMAVDAIRRQGCILIAGVAVGARDRKMSSRERESDRAVRERRRFPYARCMACLAGVAECAGDVIRICRRGKIRRMALIATRVGQLVVTINVTRLAQRCRVRARQCKFRRAMIEGRRPPQTRCVARLAGTAESAGDVIRICRRGKIRRMALVATRVGQLVVTVDMT